MSTSRVGDPQTDANSLISSAVWQLIEAQGITVTEMAVHTGLSTTASYRKLNGGVAWKANDIARIARYFGVTVGDLFSGLPLTVSSPEKQD